MKKVLLILAMIIMVTASGAMANGKAEKAEEVVGQERMLTDYLTPTSTLIAEYYKTVAQIAQLKEQIEGLENALNRLDAVIKYQQGIERRIEQEKQKEE